MSKSHVNGGKKSGGHVRRKVASAAIKRQQLPQHIPPAFADFPNFGELQDRLGYKGTLQYIEAAREEKAAQMAFLGGFVTSEENTSEQKTSAFNEATSQEIEEETNQENQENQENQKVESVSESKSEETQASPSSLESTATSAKDAHTTGQSHQNALNQHGEGDRDTDASPDLSLAQENAPDVSTLAPEQAVTALAAQPPHLVLAGLNDLRTGIAVDVAGKHAAIADAPPSIQRPVGAKAIANTDTPAATETAPKPTEARLDIVDFGSDIQTPKQEAIQQTAPLPTNDVAQPVISATPEGTLNQESVDELKGSLDGLPTSDPGLSPGTGKTPQVERQGNADPSTMQTQHRHVQAVQQQLRTEGEAERVRDRGENAVYPQVDPNEALSAQIEPFEAQAPTVEDSTVDNAVAATAAIEQGEAIKTALSSTQDNIALEQQRYQSTLDQKKAENDTAIQRVEQENREQQDRERSTLQTDVEKHRGAWAKEQTDSILAANKDASEAHTQGLIKVNNKESDANQRAAEAIQKGQETAAVERKNAEAEATRKKDEAKKEEGGFFSWAASKVSSFFEGVKAAIQDVFERARQRVQKALTEAKNFATDIIEKARKAIVDAIQLVGNALIAIGDRLLKHFPALHEKYNRAIHFVVDKAQQAINALADGLKQSVQFLLDGLGKAINGVLNL